MLVILEDKNVVVAATFFAGILTTEKPRPTEPSSNMVQHKKDIVFLVVERSFRRAVRFIVVVFGGPSNLVVFLL